MPFSGGVHESVAEPNGGSPSASQRREASASSSPSVSRGNLGLHIAQALRISLAEVEDRSWERRAQGTAAGFRP